MAKTTQMPSSSILKEERSISVYGSLTTACLNSWFATGVPGHVQPSGRPWALGVHATKDVGVKLGQAYRN